ncbi:hypothetical protein JF550_03425 [Microbacterium esteraromaticum]|uniref:Small multidrug efflux protein n=1 Tax=Microbacterium esteraromaticum TaxID=57043 RepID=A0A939DU76_9MICO|nr:hypothetical protein [Microbacterium esteraromaticum]MBN7793725.1 hypothetical protein [Microbacterium esteraromaticum]MBN8205006.1 hypothetical protein [Microbacterium esteraromaticum]MBN8415160.1 hypothetical protein [Microbacterium esteraromaticum]MBN8424562.1 hypothetical protein [Microbacterium esteraromaticum]MBY6059965.1 hypothetical protein [Microbacterium esteraromaticum]
MSEALVDFTQSLPTWLQWAGVMLAAAIPFIESYFGTLIGVVAGVPLPIAVAAAVIGNTLSMLAFVFVAATARQKVLARRAQGEELPEPSARRQKVKRMFDRFGVPGVSLLGQTVLPSQITSGMMVSFGANRNAVIFWQIVSIIMWALIFAGIGQAGIALLR